MVPLVVLVPGSGQVARVGNIFDARCRSISVEIRSLELYWFRIGYGSGAVLGNYCALSELLHTAVHGGYAFQSHYVTHRHTVLFLEGQYDACLVLYEESLLVCADDGSFYLILFLDRRCEYFCDGAERNLVFLTEFDEFATLTWNKEYVVEPVHAAKLGHEFDVKGVGTFRKSEVSRSESPVSGYVLYVAEVVVKSRRPYLTVSGEANLEVRTDKGVGSTLRVSLCAELKAEVAVTGNIYLLYGEEVRSGAEENVILS